MIGIKPPWLLHIALMFCPREFREHFGEELEHDLDASRHKPLPLLRTCWNVFGAGMQLHGEAIVRDLRFAVKSFAKTPLFTIVAVGTIAVAVGVNVAIASIVANVLLRPLPYPDADRLVFINETLRHGPSPQLPYPDFRDIQRDNVTLDSVSLSRSTGYTIIGAGTPRELVGRQIDPNFFSLLSIHAELGRTFTAADMGTNRAVISEGLWRESFGADPGILKRSILLNSIDYGARGPHSVDGRYRVVGIVPNTDAPDNWGMIPTEVWLPIPTHDREALAPGSFNYSVIARLKQNVNPAQSRRDLDRILKRSTRLRPGNHEGGFVGTVVTPLLERITAPLRLLLWLLYAAAGIVLLVACVNVANLQLGRTAARQGEFAIRSALGASSSRLIVQATVESGLLTALGCACGLMLGQLTLSFFAQMGASHLPRWQDVAIDGRMFSYSAALVVVVAFFTGTLPALARRRNAATSLHSSSRSTSAAFTGRIRAGLLVAEITLAVALSIPAGLLFRSFLALTHVDVGFDGQNTYWVQTDGLPKTGVRRLENRLALLPGVVKVAASTDAPFSGQVNSTGFATPAGVEKLRDAPISFVEPQFFQTLRIPLVRGRYFLDSDGAFDRPVMIVSATFARAFFGTTDVLGRRVMPEDGDAPQRGNAIVGVVADTRDSFSGPAQARAYLPLAQAPFAGGFLLRLSDGLSPSSKAIDKAFARVDPELAPPMISSYRELFARDAFKAQILVELFGFFALLALILAISGVYAVCAYGVERRTHELGIRRAIGAQSADLLRDVIGGALRQSALGIAFGIVLAALFTRALSGILFETSVLDPLTFALVVLALVACTVAAAIIPASRAARMDPVGALRYE